MHCILFQTLFLSSVLLIAKPEMYTSLAELEDLLHTGGVVSKALITYLDKEEERLKHVRWLSAEFKKLYEAAANDVQHFVSNPLQAYLLVKRLTADWKIAQLLIENPYSKDMISNLTQSSLKFPDSEDLNGAATALMRLQDTYLLETSTLARGEIEGTTTFSQLSAGDCFELGYQAYNNNEYSHVVAWLKESLLRLEDEDDIKSANKHDLLEYLAYSYFMMDDIPNAIKYTKDLLEIDAGSYKALVNLNFYENALKKNDLLEKETELETGENYVEGEDDNEDEIKAIMDDYNKLCRGETMKSVAELSKLHCRYITNNNSYLMLQPIKEEVINLNPRIIIYHDVISDKIVESLKHLSVPKLSRATVQNPLTLEQETAAYRVSKSAWLEDFEHEAVARSSRIIEDITGLETDTAEYLHVINYGIGGHYLPHYDFRREGEVDGFAVLGTGNRIATWIYYLSDVDAGGATVFPLAGVYLKPEKGSAAFWYNLMKSGDGDLDTLHAACPVLAGSKWIANKWLHEREQEFRRPCSLNPLE